MNPVADSSEKRGFVDQGPAATADSIAAEQHATFASQTDVPQDVSPIAIFLLGFVLDWLEITLILLPIFAPIVAGLDFGNGLAPDQLLIWFGILVAVNLQTSFLTPPFGFSLFYLRGAAGDQLTTPQIYRGVLPFIALQVLVLALLILFPGLITGFTS